MSSKHQRAKRARRGDRSFQPGSAGKGDGDRTTDVDAYRANYDEINWGRPQKLIPPIEVNHVTYEPYENPYLQIAPDGTRYLGEAY